jgi:hypothetical protein
VIAGGGSGVCAAAVSAASVSARRGREATFMAGGLFGFARHERRRNGDRGTPGLKFRL